MRLTVEYCLPEPTLSAPDGAVVRLAAKEVVTKEVRVSKKRMMIYMSTRKKMLVL